MSVATKKLRPVLEWLLPFRLGRHADHRQGTRYGEA